MNMLGTLESILDYMGREVEGSLERAPELERREGEFCFRDEAGVVYRLDGKGGFEIEEPGQIGASEETPEQTVERLRREVLAYRKRREQSAALPPYAVNRLRDGSLGLTEKRAKQLLQAFQSEICPEWKRKWIFRSLKTEEEAAFCVLCANGDRRPSFAAPAFEKIRQKSLLFTVALENGGSAQSDEVLVRFAGDEAFLRALKDWKGERGAGYVLTEHRARELLRAIEERKLSGLPDEDAVTESLLRGEITEALEPALARVTKEESLLRLLLAGLGRQANRQIVRRADALSHGSCFKACLTGLILENGLDGAEEDALTMLEHEQLVRVLRDSRSEDVRREADHRLWLRMEEKKKKIGIAHSLSPEESDALAGWYADCETLCFPFCLKLLDRERLHEVFVRRLEKGYDTDALLPYLREERLTAEQFARMYVSPNSPKTRAFAEHLLPASSPERLSRLLSGQNDLRLKGAVYAELKRRGADAEKVRAQLDPLVMPRIEAAKTPGGYQKGILWNLYVELGPVLAADYGLTVEHSESETQDGEIWESNELCYDGQSWQI